MPLLVMKDMKVTHIKSQHKTEFISLDNVVSCHYKNIKLPSTDWQMLKLYVDNRIYLYPDCDKIKLLQADDIICSHHGESQVPLGTVCCANCQEGRFMFECSLYQPRSDHGPPCWTAQSSVPTGLGKLWTNYPTVSVTQPILRGIPCTPPVLGKR